jgi:two-component system alkaline phosphatase synthesis response regulator PhoP
MIYYVEDEVNIRDLVVYTLESTGLTAKGYPDAQALYAAIREQKPDLILLDIMLPGEDGISILKKLRRDPDTENIPVIMATARGAEYDKVRALDLGADDYVTKPYAMMELVSRVKAVLRRTGRSADQAASGEAGDSPEELLHCGAIFMNTRKHEVTVNDQSIQLTLKEYELLRKLLMNPECVLTREQILEDVWGYEFDGETRTVDVHVRTLRAKLGPAGNQIETIRGVGYRITGD